MVILTLIILYFSIVKLEYDTIFSYLTKNSNVISFYLYITKEINNIMYNKINYEEVVENIIIYEYNSIINILTVLYLHLMMTRYENVLQEEILQINNLK